MKQVIEKTTRQSLHNSSDGKTARHRRGMATPATLPASGHPPQNVVRGLKLEIRLCRASSVIVKPQGASAYHQPTALDAWRRGGERALEDRGNAGKTHFVRLSFSSAGDLLYWTWPAMSSRRENGRKKEWAQ
ncbi:hypothetical protein PMIN04_013029 [Paraphaeosphaeria minitans]